MKIIDNSFGSVWYREEDEEILLQALEMMSLPVEEQKSLGRIVEFWYNIGDNPKVGLLRVETDGLTLRGDLRPRRGGEVCKVLWYKILEDLDGKRTSKYEVVDMCYVRVSVDPLWSGVKFFKGYSKETDAMLHKSLGIPVGWDEC